MRCNGQQSSPLCRVLRWLRGRWGFTTGGQQGEDEGGQRMQGCNHEIVGERHKSVRVTFVSHAPKTCVSR